MTPEQLFQIIILTIVVIIGRAVFGNRAAILTWIMSRRASRAAADAGTRSVHVPVASTSTDERAAIVALPAPADTDALDDGTETPRISRRLSDAEIVTVLAVQRAPGGRYRFSANQITQLVGGARADVLAQVRAIRDNAPPVEYRPVTPEQAAVREHLGLPTR